MDRKPTPKNNPILLALCVCVGFGIPALGDFISNLDAPLWDVLLMALFLTSPFLLVIAFIVYLHWWAFFKRD